MKQGTKKLLYFSSCAMALGLILAAAAYFGGAKISGVTFGPDGAHVAEDTQKTLTREFPEGFHSLDLNVESGDVELVPSDRFGAEIESCGGDALSCSAEDGVLKITGSTARRVVWMNFDFGPQKHSKIKILIPQSAPLKRLKLRMTDGSADLSGFSAESTDVQNRYGNLRISDASCGAVSIVLGNGSGTMKDLKAETLNFTNNYGDSDFENLSLSSPQQASICANNGSISVRNFSASAVTVENTYGGTQLNSLKLSRLVCSMKNGDLSISESTVDNAILNDSYGSIQASGLDSGGLTAYGKNGDINLGGTLKGKSDIHSDYGSVGVKSSLPQDRYALNLSTEYGNVTVGGKKLNGALLQTGTAENGLDVSAKSGNVTADFGEPTK